jgi:hypothetical protein
VKSYRCDDKDIMIDFEKIRDENDEDRDDCLWLIYKNNCVWKGKPTWREIARLKVPVPEEIRMRAAQMKSQTTQKRTRKGASSGPKLAIMPPPPRPIEEIDEGPTKVSNVDEARVEQIEESQSEPVVELPADNTPVIKPVVRKPLRKPVR